MPWYNIYGYLRLQLPNMCIELCVSGGSGAQYTYMINSGVQPRGASGPCKYFSSSNDNPPDSECVICCCHDVGTYKKPQYLILQFINPTM